MSGFSIDDDFDALLDSMTVPNESTNANTNTNASQQSDLQQNAQHANGDTKPAVGSQWTSLQDQEQLDFMAWLEGADDKTALLAAKEEPGEQKPDIQTPEPDITVHSPDHSAVVAKTPASKDIATLLQSSFVDVEELRTACLQAGTIPKSLRAQVWSYLLSGQSQPDVQVDMWHYDSSKIQNAAVLEADCAAAAKSTLEKFQNHEDFSLLTNLSNDLKDVISLYCVRKNLPYHPTYLATLLPLLAPPCSMSRPQASLCLYALCSHLFPIIGLSPTASAVGLEKYHSWVRLLLGYHFPALMQHLDRALPQWEDIVQDSLTVVASSDETQTVSDRTSTASDGSSPASNSPGREQPGNISVAWTCGFFAGCLPPAELTQLWDWGIIQGNKYASLYLTIGLFGMFADSLLNLTGPQIKNWMAAVNSGQDDWHM